MNNKNINVNIIIPSIIIHNKDPHTGIPFMPHMAAYLAATLSEKYYVNIIDSLGINSSYTRVFDKFILIGINEEQILKRINKNSKYAFIYCRTIEDLFSVERIVKKLKQNTKLKVILFENIQTTNSFSLRLISDYLFNIGADALIFGEPEIISLEALDYFENGKDPKTIPDFAYKIKNKHYVNDKKFFNKNLDEIPFPKWELFDLQGYWDLGFAHAPIKKDKKFLPLITSRGCPYRCKFCVAPTLNPTWRARSPSNIIKEIEHFYKTMNIRDFHVSDLDPTVNDLRTKEICKELINKNFNIEWKFAQGTKIETIKSLETLDLLKKSGLTFFSFSPESGSKNLMKKLNKPFDYPKALKMTSYMYKIGITTQACFLIGTPEETNFDILKSIIYSIRLTIRGVDEIAVFIYSPIPGSELSSHFEVKNFNHYSELTRSPTWRKDYTKLMFIRYLMYTIDRKSVV
jgi:radical SAM superfamily enzyme YgiQ (UPF0313 family)